MTGLKICLMITIAVMAFGSVCSIVRAGRPEGNPGSMVAVITVVNLFMILTAYAALRTLP